ncbi:MAG: hypothetical protein LBC99_06760 [Spirochaetota bacterium]|nr:hypothetical protein [Spirochaetota bacterium]
MQQFLLDNLGRAIDRLIERCALLDKDRTVLAHALARVQQELQHTRASHIELEQRCRRLEARQEEAALRLEKLLAALPYSEHGCADPAFMPCGYTPRMANSAGTEDVAVESAVGECAQPDISPADLPQEQAADQESREPLQSTVKPFDIGSLERIARLAADSSKGRNVKPDTQESALPDTQETKAALDSAAGMQDRLF